MIANVFCLFVKKDTILQKFLVTECNRLLDRKSIIQDLLHEPEHFNLLLLNYPMYGHR